MHWLKHRAVCGGRGSVNGNSPRTELPEEGILKQDRSTEDQPLIQNSCHTSQGQCQSTEGRSPEQF